MNAAWITSHPALVCTILLACSNLFMTVAWYGHLRLLDDRPWWIAALISWGIALFEYLLQVPGNRIGYTTLSLAQLKILQEVITLVVFVPFAMLFMGATLQARLPVGGPVHDGRRVFHFPVVTRQRVTAPSIASTCTFTSSASAARSWAASPRSRKRAGHTRHRLRRQRLSADEHAARGARHRADRGLRRGAARRPGDGADVFVVGNVVSRGNPLIEAILDRGLPYTSGPQWLAENVLRTSGCSRSPGTHGKTTTSAMLAWILEHAGLEPGFLIGGVPSNFGVSARLSDSAFFVIEADEYDTAFFDKRSKFVHYRPRTAILNNLEFDHADIFPDLAAIETQFHHLVRTVPRQRALVVNGGDASARARAGARLLDAGRALRLAAGRGTGDRTGRSPSTARSCSAARRRARLDVRAQPGATTG